MPKKGMLGKSVRLRAGRVVTEDQVTDKVISALVAELEIAARVLQELGRAANTQRAMDSRSVESITSSMHYLYVREEEGMGASIPPSHSKSSELVPAIGKDPGRQPFDGIDHG